MAWRDEELRAAWWPPLPVWLPAWLLARTAASVFLPCRHLVPATCFPLACLHSSLPTASFPEFLPPCALQLSVCTMRDASSMAAPQPGMQLRPFRQTSCVTRTELVYPPSTHIGRPLVELSPCAPPMLCWRSAWCCCSPVLLRCKPGCLLRVLLDPCPWPGPPLHLTLPCACGQLPGHPSRPSTATILWHTLQALPHFV